MSKAKKFRVKSRLAMLAFEPGGVAVHTALKQADAALEPLRQPSLVIIDDLIAQIDARFGRDAAGRANEPYEDLYVLCSGIIDLALFVAGSGVVEAARSFCGLVDLSQELEIRAWDAVDVHIEALKLLRTAGASMSETQRRSILEGLTKVTLKRVGDPNEVVAAPKMTG